jgi:hypothetical protein
MVESQAGQPEITNSDDQARQEGRGLKEIEAQYWKCLAHAVLPRNDL